MREFAWVAAASVAVTACGGAAKVAAPQTSKAGPSAKPAAAVVDTGPDYLVITPPHLADAVEPLLAHRRAGGHRPAVVATDYESAEEVKSTIDEVRQKAGGALRFVLLVGDVNDEHDDDRGDVPTFYKPKLRYGGHYLRSRTFPTDTPYAMVDGKLDLAVGRLPVRTQSELAAVVQKIIRYETAPVTHAWPRKLVLRAGIAGFGAFVDAAIENTAMNMLSNHVPYDFDLRVTFPKEGSAYASRPDRLSESLVEDAEAGALLFAYVGHSGKSHLQHVQFGDGYYSLGGNHEFDAMQIPEGAPLFLSLACDAGAFDMWNNNHSIAEAAVLNPFGPIAAFASSRVSHPYTNLLYGQAVIAELLQKRPATLGEGINAVKRRMVASSNMVGELLTETNTDALKEEHVDLYNLLGDPATRIRYPEALAVSAPAEASPGSAITVTLKSPVGGKATITLETERRVIHKPLEPLDELSESAKLAALDKNHARANDKRLRVIEVAVPSGTSTHTLRLPTEVGRYVVKAFVRGAKNQRAAAGHHAIQAR